ncbi:MAG: hypothetical protein EHM44_05685 [Ignavibacteriales bacterium]|nr:MAG: hypothetical protein EHM44_10920 [Ignavibacteriales bacterium]RPI63111.1 MAG: hypothetical protein EHM44_05685 [Ignavibacteriales bacterium]
MKINIFPAFFFTLSLLLLILNFSCNTTEPDDELKPGRRDYTWTVDTINSSAYYRMWGSSPVDLWATGSGDWDKSIGNFDGYRWLTFGVDGIINPKGLFGFDKNNLFVSAENGRIWRYNGNTWTLFAELSKDGQTNFAFNDIWGISSNDFYVFGGLPDTIIGAFNNSVIAHYYNNNWLMLDTREMNGIVAKVYKNSKDNKIYSLTYKAGGGIDPDSSIIYEYDQSNFKKIYSSIWTGGLQADIYLIDNEVYFVLGNQIARRVNGQFQSFLQVNNPKFYQRIWGKSSKDIFLLMTDGLAHYNRSDIQYLFYFTVTPRTQIFGVALFEKEVFFQVYESQTGLSMSYHGKID